ncbi:MAG: hypothetical protein JWP74_2998 [Marmoricola sp.]|nr:hypothetical protein [Marmoricola sp.]
MSRRVRLHLGAVALVVLALVSACGGSGSKGASGSPSDPQTRLGTSTPGSQPTEVTVPCKKFAGVAQKITDTQTKLYSGQASDSTLADLAAGLKTVKTGAPSDVKAAVDELLSAFVTARREISKPTAAGTAKLQRMASKLSSDGRTVTSYVLKQCRS